MGFALRWISIVFWISSCVQAGPPNPATEAIAAFISNYAGRDVTEKAALLEKIASHPSITKSNVTLLEVELVISFLESRIGETNTKELFRTRLGTLGCRHAPLRAIVGASDFLIGRDATNIRLVANFSSFASRHGRLGEIIKMRYDWLALPDMLKMEGPLYAQMMNNSTCPPIFSMLFFTTSMPTPRPETLVTCAAVEKPGAKIKL